jgi:hypothetical protein
MNIRMQETPPPKEIPVDEAAQCLGLIAGLRAEQDHHGGRCANCHTYEVGPRWLIWVPDSVQLGDSVAAISDQCRCNAFNGYFSGWCLKCAKRLGHSPYADGVKFQERPDDGMIPKITVKPRSFLRKLRNFLMGQ